MLGLGDIVLPGLLVVFAIRYDYAHFTRLCEQEDRRVEAANQEEEESQQQQQ